MSLDGRGIFGERRSILPTHFVYSPKNKKFLYSRLNNILSDISDEEWIEGVSVRGMAVL
jgi:hypothetical protein